MSYQVLARKWRPKTFDQLVGQEHVSQALVNGLDQDRLHHAFLFTGTRGVGKTTIARILAKCLNCEAGTSSQPCGECGSCVDLDEGRFVDMIEIDAASRTGVDDMRELLESVQYTPTRGRFKIYVIDEVHMLSGHSFNALLKTLEEPPPHVKFVLATTDPQKIPVTILSRCLRFNLRRLLPEQIRDYLESLVTAEGIETEAEALGALARAADGSMRDGLSLLDQAIAFGGGKLAMSDLESMLGLVEHEHLASMIRSLAAGDAEGMLGIVEELVAQSRDLDTVLLNLAEVLHRVTLAQCVPGYRDNERSDWPAIERLAESLSVEDAQLFYQIAIKGRNELGLAPDPRTGLEMTLLRMLAFRPADTRPPTEDGSAPAAPERKKSAGEGATGASAAAPTTASNPAQSAVQNAKPEKAPAAPQTESAPATDSDWLSIQGRLEVNGQVRELARNIELKSRDGNVWTFVIVEALKHLGSKACQSRLERALGNLMDQDITVRLVEERAAPERTAAATEQEQVKQNQSDAERAIDEDPNVRELKDKMGARVIDDSIQPIQ
ncbi:MAG: DNA polymerase III subunit gamma/tau [Xanthomonadales bacterium]|nr:DNA polymerase III subunit gamma/tau [Gammaproteobacteria bacterium]MBT8055321.1 DNA polymerase III subunit gamma/tau [Gammaproteobacteria bacterium]NNJ78057.1 DNA polymerase III subunit gamma/tau [Xanthomonadales bacterium]NNL05506.1 DNA polymerase III subunit gamma/tau [Xanthomonadales bacterium]